MNKKMLGGALQPLFQLARENRNNETHAERLLWGYLKTKPLVFESRRKHPYSIYILDCYCHFLKLPNEVDGSVHHADKMRINDEERQNFLRNDGINILHFQTRKY